MDFEQLYHFLFETYMGIGCLVLAGFVITLIVAVILERRTRKRFKEHPKTDDDWSFFDDDREQENTEQK